MTPNGVEINPRVCQIAPASLLLAGADPNQSWVFAGDSLAQPIVGRDRRDGALKMVSSCSGTRRGRDHQRCVFGVSGDHQRSVFGVGGERQRSVFGVGGER